MINITNGNIFDSAAEALVNPVNTHSVMGKGLAKEFKDRYPMNFRGYKALCDHKVFYPGDIYCNKENDKWIVNFATKDHWRNPSKIEWIHKGLLQLAGFISQNEIVSIAIPKIGCGLGGLNWPTVKQMIVYSMKHLENNHDFTTYIYE